MKSSGTPGLTKMKSGRVLLMRMDRLGNLTHS